VSTWQSSGYGLGEVNPVSSTVDKWRTNLKTALGTDKYNQLAALGFNPVAAAQDWFTIFKAAVEANHTTDGPTLAKWIETNGYKGGLRADYTFTPQRHNGFTADNVGWAQPRLTLRSDRPIRARPHGRARSRFRPCGGG